MELSKLCEKIINDANLKAAEIANEADKKSLELISAADKKHNEKAEKIKAKAALTAKDAYDRIVSAANLSSGRKILETKRMLINEAFEKALLKLENMTVEEYKGFISEKAKDISETASVEIAAKYADSVSDEFIHSINPKLTKSKNTVESGFNIVMDKSSLNYNFKEIIKQIAEERDSEVSSLLFS